VFFTFSDILNGISPFDLMVARNMSIQTSLFCIQTIVQQMMSLTLWNVC